MHFESEVIEPWQAAWRHFRSSRQRGGASGAAPAADALDADAGAGGGAEASESAAEGIGDQSRVVLPSGDCVYTWGCLDWTTSNLHNIVKYF